MAKPRPIPGLDPDRRLRPNARRILAVRIAEVYHYDGRVADLLGGQRLRTGVYRLTFNTAAYGNAFYPEVVVMFRVSDPEQHHHIPLLLSAYGYATYRGS